jgi:hypothetical protein
MTWVLDGGGGIDVGTLPVEAPLAYVAFGSVFRTVGWSVRVEYASLPSRDLDEVRSLRVSILRAGLEGCVLPLEGNHLSFGACAGLYGGPLFVAGEGIGEPSRGSTFVLQAQLGPHAWWRLGRTFGLVLELDYVAPLVRPAVVFVGPDRPQDVHRVGAGLAASMGLRLAL